MARSRSRSAARDVMGGGAPNKALYHASSPPRRRWTRSQSRDAEASGSHRHDGDGGGGGGRQEWRRSAGAGAGNAHVAGLDAIAESPAKSLQRPSSARQESPEDAINMSGTTILPLEPETDLDPDMMIEALPSLDREANGVLNILVPGALDPVSLVNAVKKLRDPQNPQRKRLNRFMLKLDSEAAYFGQQTYIDTRQINQLVTSALARKAIPASENWMPDPIVQKANLARFALEVLLAESSNAQKTESQRKAIDGLGDFPLPYMNDCRIPPVNRGESAHVLDTLWLALEIRTQSLLMKLEMHQHDDKFDPETIVNQVFYDEVIQGEVYDDSRPPLRGFETPRFKDQHGRFPWRLDEFVYPHINDIRATLAEEDDTEAKIRALQGTYRWHRFVSKAAQWVRSRYDEINRALEAQPKAEDVRDYFVIDETPQRQSFKTSISNTPSPRPSGAVPEPVKTVPQPPQVQKPQEPVSDKVAAKAKDKERRKSSKGAYLNMPGIQRLMQRELESEGPRGRRQTDFIRPAREKSLDVRRETLSSPPPRSPPEHREIPASPDGSPTLLQDDEDIFGGSQFRLQPQRDREPPERSHSPPMRRTTSVQPREDTMAGMPSSEEVWNAAINTKTPRPAATNTFSPRINLNPKNLGIRRKTPAAFVDRQEDARRVSPISDTDPRSVERQRPAPALSRTSRKRTRNEAEDDEDEFSRYERAIDPSKRAQKPDHHRPRVQKRRRVDETGQHATEPRRGNTPPLGSSTAPSTSTSAAPPAPPALARPPQLRQPSQTHPTTNTDSTTDSTSAPRDFIPTAAPRSYIPETKTRMRWCAEEDRRLVRLISECGTGWADLVRVNYAQPVREGEVRIERDQMQYKDRARNLKIIYYRQGRQNELPPQFRYVTMSEKDKAALRKRGIQVD